MPLRREVVFNEVISNMNGLEVRAFIIAGEEIQKQLGCQYCACLSAGRPEEPMNFDELGFETLADAKRAIERFVNDEDKQIVFADGLPGSYLS